MTMYSSETKKDAVTLAFEILAIIIAANPALSGTEIRREDVAQVLEAHLSGKLNEAGE